ncbi:MAG: helix-hairpin-helix domain-containing protein [Phycisphaerae bacterium]|nr:helix-hairpin-helix domain-containing protein [Saprospiraceae bacterium]
MKTRFFNYLRFNRAERNGTLALFVLAAVFFAIPEISRYFRVSPKTDFAPFQIETQAFRAALANGKNDARESSGALFNFDPNTASFDDFVRLGLSEKVSNIICNYRDKGGDFREPADFQKIWSLKKEDYTRLLPYIHIGTAEETPREKRPEKPAAELFAFDPNTSTEEDLLRLGLPNRAVKSILNYRSKGGQFRKKEDLEKIYTLDEDDYDRIAPYATFSGAIASAAVTRPVVYAGGFAAPSKKGLDKGPVDINRANVEDWMSLPGIGETRARQLVNFREKLGGFISVRQLGEMYGLPDSVFQGIKANLVISTADIRKINLNTASVADLDTHPYISKRQAELIVAYREQHGAFASSDDLGKMRAFSDQAWLAKVGPYLGVE